MTHREIKEHLNVPLSTLDSWKNESHPKHKLYLLLTNTDAKYVEKKISTENKTHRIFHIVNRNSIESYNWKDVQNAFKKDNYTKASSKETIIYSKFFKECEPDDLDSLVKTFNVSKRNIKKIYLTSPLRKLTGVAKVWDTRFRIPTTDRYTPKKREYKSSIDLEYLL